jgi:hypothetical protein
MVKSVGNVSSNTFGDSVLGTTKLKLILKLQHTSLLIGGVITGEVQDFI